MVLASPATLQKLRRYRVRSGSFLSVQAGGPGSGRHPGFSITPLPGRDTHNWAMHPTKGVMFDPHPNRLHVDWFKEIGLPDTGSAFDKIPRGFGKVSDYHKDILLVNYQNHEKAPIPDEVVRALRNAYPNHAMTSLATGEEISACTTWQSFVQCGKAWYDQALSGDQKLQELCEDSKAFQSKIDNFDRAILGHGLGRIHNPATFQQIQSTVFKLIAVQDSLYKQRAVINWELTKEVLYQLGTPEPGQPILRSNEHRDAGVINQYVRDFQGMVLSNGPKLRINGTKGEKEGPGRSYYENENRTAYLRANPDRGAVWHELGHWIEHTVPGVNAAAIAYYHYRTKGETPIPLTVLQKPGHRPDELACPDHFVEPYIGKHYGGSGGSTELVSMGLQYLAQDPVKLFQDKELLYFVLGVLKQAREKGD